MQKCKLVDTTISQKKAHIEGVQQNFSIKPFNQMVRVLTHAISSNMFRLLKHNSKYLKHIPSQDNKNKTLKAKILTNWLHTLSWNENVKLAYIIYVVYDN